MGRLKASYNWLTKTKLGFFTVVVVFFWIKTYLTYITKFNLGVVGSMQNFLLLINPLPTAILLIGIGLFFKGRKSYWIMVIIDFLLSHHQEYQFPIEQHHNYKMNFLLLMA